MVLKHQHTVTFNDGQHKWLKDRADTDKVSVAHIIRAAVQREMCVRKAKLSAEAQILINDIRWVGGGCEISQDIWPIAEEIVAAGLGTLSAARGPDNQWKRLEVRQ